MINFNKKDSVADAVDSILKKEEVEQIDEISSGLATSYLNRRTAQHKPNLNSPETSNRDAKVAKGISSASRREHGFGRDKGAENKVTGRFEYRKNVGVTHTFNKEEVESVDEELKGNQHKIDKNNNNKIDAQDFKILRGKKSLKSFKKENEEHSVLDQMINEVLSKDASAGAWIHDFVHSDNPKFAGKSKDKRKEMALAAYYAKQRNEEVEQLDELSPELQHSYFKKAYAQKNDKTVPKETRQKRSKGMNKVINRTLRRNTISTPGASQDFKDQEARRGIGHVRDHVETDAQVMGEGWDDMVKAAKDSVKSGPKPSGGSGVKQGTRYGGGKQTSKPEQEDDDKKKVTEGKQPLDNVPFDPPYNTTSSPEVKDKSGAVHTPMSRVKHLARQAMKKVKKNLGK